MRTEEKQKEEQIDYIAEKIFESDLIMANRYDSVLEDVIEKVYTEIYTLEIEERYFYMVY